MKGSFSLFPQGFGVSLCELLSGYLALLEGQKQREWESNSLVGSLSIQGAYGCEGSWDISIMVRGQGTLLYTTDILYLVMGGSKVKQLSQTAGHRIGHSQTAQDQGCEGLQQAMKSCRALLCICFFVFSLSVWCELLSPMNTSAEVEAVFRAYHREEVITEVDKVHLVISRWP